MESPASPLDLAQAPWTGATPAADGSAARGPAGVWRRLCALAVDVVLVWLLLRVGDLLTGTLARWDLVARAFDHTWALVVPASYFVVLHGTWGRTAGKALTGARVVAASGEPLSYARALARYFAWLLSAVSLGAGFLVAAARDDRRALHDLVAGTRVVRVR